MTFDNPCVIELATGTGRFGLLKRLLASLTGGLGGTGRTDMLLQQHHPKMDACGARSRVMWTNRPPDPATSPQYNHLGGSSKEAQSANLRVA